MARLGIFCLPWTGHLNPFATLSRELEKRGHEVIFFHVPDFAGEVRGRDLHFEAYGEQKYPAGTFAERYREMSRLEGLAAARIGLQILTTQAEALFTTAEDVIKRFDLDLWLVDQLDYAAPALAAKMGAPFVSVIVGLMRHYEEGVPGFSGEAYPGDAASKERDRRFNEAMLAVSQPYRDYVGAFRERTGSGPFSYDTVWSNLAQITQQPEEFEFPRRALPKCFHFAGPFTGTAYRPATKFPWEWLSDKPLVLASFGTTQNRNRHLYETVVETAAGLDAQVVLSTGGAEVSGLTGAGSENLLIVDFAPQLELLERASLMITHAGMNSTLESLERGVPMVAVPIGNDQHGVAARIEWSGTGVRIPAARFDAAGLRARIEAMLGEGECREAAQRFKRIIGSAKGVEKAVGIIERVIATGRPVLSGAPVEGLPVQIEEEEAR